MLWQLIRLSTNQPLNEPQRLPENWGPIFGLENFKDRIGDLSWLGNEYVDLGWVIAGELPPEPVPASKAEIEWDRALGLLAASDWAMLPDVPMTAGNKALWVEYRRALREIKLQSEFPDNITWPVRPS